MSQFIYIERDVTEEELEQVRRGFVENELFHSQVHQTSDRFGFDTMVGEKFE